MLICVRANGKLEFVPPTPEFFDRTLKEKGYEAIKTTLYAYLAARLQKAQILHRVISLPDNVEADLRAALERILFAQKWDFGTAEEIRTALSEKLIENLQKSPNILNRFKMRVTTELSPIRSVGATLSSREDLSNIRPTMT